MDMQQQQWQPQQLQTHPPPTVIFPGQKYHTTCGVVIAKAYWDCAPPPVSGQEPKQLGDLDPKPQNQPSGGTNLETLDVETRRAIDRKRKAALAKEDARRVTAMLKVPICERGTEEEIMFAISDVIGHPKTWKQYLADIFWSQHWGNDGLMKIVCFLAYNGLPYHLMQQWVAVRGVACEQRKLGINWENTMQGKCKRGAFTWDLIAKDYCLLDTGEPTTIPESKRSKQSPD